MDILLVHFLSHQIGMKSIPASTPTSKSFAERLKTARKINKLTQEELANNAGLSVITLSKLESGANKPSFDVIVALSKTMNIEPNYFFGWVDSIDLGSSSQRRMKMNELILNSSSLDDEWLDVIISVIKTAKK